MRIEPIAPSPRAQNRRTREEALARAAQFQRDAIEARRAGATMEKLRLMFNKAREVGLDG